MKGGGWWKVVEGGRCGEIRGEHAPAIISMDMLTRC